MDTSSFGAYQKSALPSHLRHRSSQMPNGGSPLQTSVGVKELERLTASIHSLNDGRRSLDLSSPQGSQSSTQQTDASQSRYRRTESGISSANLNVAPRDPRDKTSELNISRPSSSNSLDTPIDFDGLSWPSKLPCGMSSGAAAEGPE